ncbi:Spy/CpxP family protein refolding chaperone [Massilia sp. TWP1-3-3]|uniref:Spy/CpxP family protein refolding chaperone n=1 Tax=Massilia sp. TWP1-3-3 TaxID=2804573 RepID=UPI003CF974A1
MNTLRKSILIGMTVFGLGGTTLAVQASDAPTTKHEQRQAKWGEHAAAREQKLHDALKLTPAQAGAWTTYAAAVKPAAGKERGERGAWKSMPAPERMEKGVEMAKQHLATMETRLAATTAFYGVLTAEQKALFDANSMHHRRHGGHGMHG